MALMELSTRKLTIIAAMAVGLMLSSLWWHFSSGNEQGQEQWQQADDSERLRMELESWVKWLKELPQNQLAEALERRVDESVPPAQRRTVMRQTWLLLSKVNGYTPREVVRYRDGEIVRATWPTGNGGQVALVFRCPSGSTPKLLRSNM